MTEPGPIAGARRLLREQRFGTLATLTPDGAPFASLVGCATDSRGAPILLLSDLAVHTRNVKLDGRVSLLLDGSCDSASRLMGERLSVSGRLAPCSADEVRRRYLARHPDAAMLLDMADFRFYRLSVEHAHQVAGFGKIDQFAPDDLLVPTALADELDALAPSAIDHMHADHADAVCLMAGGDSDAVIVGIDADGMNLIQGHHPVRIMFAARLSSIEGLRESITEVVRQIRRNSG